MPLTQGNEMVHSRHSGRLAICLFATIILLDSQAFANSKRKRATARCPKFIADTVRGEVGSRTDFVCYRKKKAALRAGLLTRAQSPQANSCSPTTAQRRQKKRRRKVKCPKFIAYRELGFFGSKREFRCYRKLEHAIEDGFSPLGQNCAVPPNTPTSGSTRPAPPEYAVVGEEFYYPLPLDQTQNEHNVENLVFSESPLGFRHDPDRQGVSWIPIDEQVGVHQISYGGTINGVEFQESYSVRVGRFETVLAETVTEQGATLTFEGTGSPIDGTQVQIAPSVLPAPTRIKLQVLTGVDTSSDQSARMLGIGPPFRILAEGASSFEASIVAPDLLQSLPKGRTEESLALATSPSPDLGNTPGEYSAESLSISLNAEWASCIPSDFEQTRLNAFLRFVSLPPSEWNLGEVDNIYIYEGATQLPEFERSFLPQRIRSDLAVVRDFFDTWAIVPSDVPLFVLLTPGGGGGSALYNTITYNPFSDKRYLTRPVTYLPPYAVPNGCTRDSCNVIVDSARVLILLHEYFHTLQTRGIGCQKFEGAKGSGALFEATTVLVENIFTPVLLSALGYHPPQHIPDISLRWRYQFEDSALPQLTLAGLAVPLDQQFAYLHAIFFDYLTSTHGFDMRDFWVAMAGPLSNPLVGFVGEDARPALAVLETYLETKGIVNPFIAGRESLAHLYLDFVFQYRFLQEVEKISLIWEVARRYAIDFRAPSLFVSADPDAKTAKIIDLSLRPLAGESFEVTLEGSSFSNKNVVLRPVSGSGHSERIIGNAYGCRTLTYGADVPDFTQPLRDCTLLGQFSGANFNLHLGKARNSYEFLVVNVVNSDFVDFQLAMIEVAAEGPELSVSPEGPFFPTPFEFESVSYSSTPLLPRELVVKNTGIGSESLVWESRYYHPMLQIEPSSGVLAAGESTSVSVSWSDLSDYSPGSIQSDLLRIFAPAQNIPPAPLSVSVQKEVAPECSQDNTYQTFISGQSIVQVGATRAWAGGVLLPCSLDHNNPDDDFFFSQTNTIDFGDGTIQDTPNHSYSTPGLYTVTATVTVKRTNINTGVPVTLGTFDTSMLVRVTEEDPFEFGGLRFADQGEFVTSIFREIHINTGEALPTIELEIHNTDAAPILFQTYEDVLSSNSNLFDNPVENGFIEPGGNTTIILQSRPGIFVVPQPYATRYVIKNSVNGAEIELTVQVYVNEVE